MQNEGVKIVVGGGKICLKWCRIPRNATHWEKKRTPISNHFLYICAVKEV